MPMPPAATRALRLIRMPVTRYRRYFNTVNRKPKSARMIILRRCYIYIYVLSYYMHVLYVHRIRNRPIVKIGKPAGRPAVYRKCKRSLKPMPRFFAFPGENIRLCSRPTGNWSTDRRGRQHTRATIQGVLRTYRYRYQESRRIRIAGPPIPGHDYFPRLWVTFRFNGKQPNVHRRSGKRLPNRGARANQLPRRRRRLITTQWHLCWLKKSIPPPPIFFDGGAQFFFFFLDKIDQRCPPV